MLIVHCHFSEKSSKAVNQRPLVKKPICSSVRLQNDGLEDSWKAVTLFTVPFYSVGLSKSRTHRQWQPFCNWFQIYRGAGVVVYGGGGYFSRPSQIVPRHFSDHL